MGFLAVHHLDIVACRCGLIVCFFRAIFVQVTATTPYAAERLITFCPYMAKLLTVIALSQAILVSVCLHLERYVAKARQFEDILGLLSPGKGYEKSGRLDFSGSCAGDRRVVVICLTLIVSKPSSTSAS
jgi:hypothetical protein